MSTKQTESFDQFLSTLPEEADEAKALRNLALYSSDEISLQGKNSNRSYAVHNPHDAFFQAMMTDLRMARQFFKIYLPEPFKSRCDFSTLALQRGSFVESDLCRHLSDILYSVQLNGQKSNIYFLVEHVTHAKPTTAFQILRYQIAAMHQAMKQGHERPPIVIPILFYRGKQSPYPESCNPLDCFEDPILARETLLAAPSQLVDLSVIPDEVLATHKEMALVELLIKHMGYRDMIELVEYLTNPKFRKYLTSDQFKSVIYYIQGAGYSRNYEEFYRQFNNHARDARDIDRMQTLGAYLTQKGVEQGMQQGIEQGLQQGMQAGVHQATQAVAAKMLQQGADYEFIETVTGLSKEEIEGLN